MAIKYQPYPKYKYSGKAWLGEIPSGWESTRINSICTFEKGYGLSKGDLKNDGEYQCVLYGELFTAYKNFNVITNVRSCSDSDKAYISEGDEILIPGSTTTTGIDLASANHLPHKGVLLGGDIIILKPRKAYNKRFVSYFITNINKREFIRFSKGVTIYHIYASSIKNMPIYLPHIKEQEIIANFLDHETAKIDTLIDKQQQLIKLLKEKHEAMVTYAMIKGLNKNAPMKDSGAKWLGDIPTHWEVLKTKRFFNLECHPAPNNNDMELLSVYTDIGVRPRKDLDQKGNKASTTDGYWLVKKGDLIVNKLLAWMGAVGYSDYDGVTSPAYDILRKRRPLNVKFYHYLFRTKIAQSEFKRWSRGIMEMRLRLYFEELGRIPMPFPPEKEQDEIVDEIEKLETQYDGIIDKGNRQIKLLQERRTALISAAVTGKIDVRNWTAPA